MKLLQSNSFPELSSSRLTLRQPTLKDAKAYHNILSCEELATYSDLPPKPTEKRSERFVSWMSKLQTRGTGVAWLVNEKSSGQLLGAVRINSIEKKARCGVIGYELHPEFWNSGFATEALRAVVVCAHSTLSLNRLEAWTVVGNKASDRVLEKNGFVHEGIQREKAFFNGKFQSVNLYGRLKDDPIP